MLSVWKKKMLITTSIKSPHYYDIMRAPSAFKRHEMWFFFCARKLLCNDHHFVDGDRTSLITATSHWWTFKLAPSIWIFHEFSSVFFWNLTDVENGQRSCEKNREKKKPLRGRKIPQIFANDDDVYDDWECIVFFAYYLILHSLYSFYYLQFSIPLLSTSFLHYKIFHYIWATEELKKKFAVASYSIIFYYYYLLEKHEDSFKYFLF